jgi:hypothetical protein
VARGLKHLRAVRAQRRWREADAEIISTDLDDSPDREFHVEYRYSVDGREYINDQILPGRDAVPAPDSEDLFRQYPVHRHTTVFFDSQDPAQSALELDPFEQVLRPVLTGGGVVLLVGVWYWLLAV